MIGRSPGEGNTSEVEDSESVVKLAIAGAPTTLVDELHLI